MDKSCYNCKGLKDCQSELDQPINKEQADTWPVDCKDYKDARVPHLDLDKTAQYLAKEVIGADDWAKLSDIGRNNYTIAWKHNLLKNCKAND